ncbi:hypothetical protein ACQEXU_10905 [Vibrio sp. TRT 21S02]|uniref:hypothetical protein n=1 Tax=Vibrio sp. TRT 21S02 TaxID=3418507 RepID=UPI003CE67CFD
MKNVMSELENNVKASAVMNFVETIRGAYGAGFIDNNPTVYDIYRSAQNHVKDNYGIDTENWDDELAKESRAAGELERLRKELVKIDPKLLDVEGSIVEAFESAQESGCRIEECIHDAIEEYGKAVLSKLNSKEQ